MILNIHIPQLSHDNSSFVKADSQRFESGSAIGFFNPVIPTRNFVQSRNPEGYFRHFITQTYFQSRISLRFCIQFSSPELQIQEIPGPEKPIGDRFEWQFILKYFKGPDQVKVQL